MRSSTNCTKPLYFGLFIKRSEGGIKLTDTKTLGFDQSAAAGDLMVRAQKCDLHKNTSGFISSVPLV